MNTCTFLLGASQLSIVISFLFSTDVIKIKNEWKSVAASWFFLILGATFFGFLLGQSSSPS